MIHPLKQCAARVWDSHCGTNAPMYSHHDSSAASMASALIITIKIVKDGLAINHLSATRPILWADDPLAFE